MLRRHARVPLIGHFAFVAAASRLPCYGVHTRVINRLQRLAGLDGVIMPGFGPRMGMDEAEVVAGVQTCLEPLGSIAPSLPIPGGSEWAGTLEGVYRRVAGWTSASSRAAGSSVTPWARPLGRRVFARPGTPSAPADPGGAGAGCPELRAAMATFGADALRPEGGAR